jgi:transposase
LKNDEARATYALQEMQKMYAIERSCSEQEFDADQINKGSKTTAGSAILIALGEWMKLPYTEVLHKAISVKPLPIA